MCGICGYAGFERNERLLKRMTRVMTHRGPDDEGFFYHADVGLGMRRLSIIDVEGGKQPIISENDRISIVFNGEIYNYMALREKLIQLGHTFSTKSDTETILHLYEEYGTECVQYLRGVFVFALYDKNEKDLFIARDRLGVKPLYYWMQNGRLIFGTEIKSILQNETISREPNFVSIDAYLALRYIPGPETMLTGIYKFPSGHWMLWKDGQSVVEPYWTPEIHKGPYRSNEYYRDRFFELLTESVKMRLMSEVPLGAYLSGGLDSTAIVALMSQMADQPVKTFSVGFDWEEDELPAARAVAEEFGCDHHEIICNVKDFELLPKIMWHLDEPIGDAIVVPMYMLSKLAREHVSVVLSGEGADETMAGYLFHKVMLFADRYVRRAPKLIRNGISKTLINHIPLVLLNKVFDYPGTLGDRGRQKILDYLDLVGCKRPDKEYYFLISLLDKRDKNILYSTQMKHSLNSCFLDDASDTDINIDGSYLDLILSLQYDNWLPDDILMKQDKISMANSIEARVPFLDHMLVEFLFQTPPKLKLHGSKNKILLRDVLSRLLPGDFSQKKKKAFYIPIEKYLSQGALSEMVNICLSQESIRKRGYFNWDTVRSLRQMSGSGDFLYGKQVFALVALELWHRIYIDNESGWL